MRSTFRWTTALSGLGLVTTSLLSTQVGFSKTPMASSKMSAMATKPKMMRTQMTGTVVAHKGMMLSVMPMRGSKMAKTIMVPSTAKVMMGKKMVALSTLMKGDKVCVYMTNGKVTRVDNMGMAKMKMSTMSKK